MSGGNDFSPRPTVDCEAAQELIPAYCAGITDPEETALVAEALKSCPELQTEITDYQAIADGVLLSVPVMEPPADLKAKLLDSLAPPVSSTTAPVSVAPVSKKQNRRWGWAAAACLLLLIGSNLLWLFAVQQMRNDQDELITQISQAAGINYSNIPGRNFRQISMEDINTTQTATMRWGIGAAENTWVGAFSVTEFPELTEEFTYQLWFIREGEDPTSIGLFDVDTEGSGLIIFEINEPVGSFDLLGVTVEPGGGSPAPTTDPVLAGEI